jgi:uncharacterized membrane protein
VAVFVSKMMLPTPFDKMIVVVQALFLALGSLLLGRMGATFVASIGGLLTTIWRFTFFPFSLIFAIFYGILVDISFHAFRVRAYLESGKSERIVLSLMLSTTVIGIFTAYVMMMLNLIPKIPMLYATIIIVGVINGVIAAYAASFIWKRYLKSLTEYF